MVGDSGVKILLEIALEIKRSIDVRRSHFVLIILVVLASSL